MTAFDLFYNRVEQYKIMFLANVTFYMPERLYHTI